MIEKATELLKHIMLCDKAFNNGEISDVELFSEYNKVNNMLIALTRIRKLNKI